MIGLILFMVPALTALADEVPRMTKEELKELLGSSDLVIVDVRRGQDWNSSEFKIKGSVRESGKGIAWAKNYDKDKTIVLYCA
jgi:rhodanese-related sulfurtransferase